MERKTAAASAEARAVTHEMMATFEAYKAENETRLAALERGRGDVLHDDKLARMDQKLSEQNARIDQLTRAGKRPELGGGDPWAGAGDERKAAWNAYVRKGDVSALTLFESKSLSAGSNADGGYVVPSETERMIDMRLKEISPMREIATVRQVGSLSYKKPVSLGGATHGWVAETASRTTTDSPTLTMLEFPTAEIYAMPAATPTLIDDAFVNIDEWLADEVRTVFADQETTAFVTGDGSNKPKGFLSYTNVANASHAYGQMGYIATGAAGAFAGSNPSDALIDLIYAPKAQFRPNGRFVMNRRTASVVRKFKDSTGNYIWQPGLSFGTPPTLLGYPVTEIEQMPDIAANSYSIAFGDFAQGYLIVDRAGIRILRDPYAAKPYVLFYTTKRVGGGVQNFDAIKLLKFAAS
jgi:HK97 family phage major capsid protein